MSGLRMLADAVGLVYREWRLWCLVALIVGVGLLSTPLVPSPSMSPAGHELPPIAQRLGDAVTGTIAGWHDPAQWGRRLADDILFPLQASLSALGGPALDIGIVMANATSSPQADTALHLWLWIVVAVLVPAGTAGIYGWLRLLAAGQRLTARALVSSVPRHFGALFLLYATISAVSHLVAYLLPPESSNSALSQAVPNLWRVARAPLAFAAPAIVVREATVVAGIAAGLRLMRRMWPAAVSIWLCYLAARDVWSILGWTIGWGARMWGQPAQPILPTPTRYLLGVIADTFVGNMLALIVATAFVLLVVRSDAAGKGE